MKTHIGVYSRTVLAQSAVITAANVHDKHPLPDLLHGNEQRVYGDGAYASQKELIQSRAPLARDFTNQRVHGDGDIDEAERSKNRNKSRVRARVEHVFAVVKRLWRFSKVRYRGLAKNATRSSWRWAWPTSISHADHRMHKSVHNSERPSRRLAARPKSTPRSEQFPSNSPLSQRIHAHSPALHPATTGRRETMPCSA